MSKRYEELDSLRGLAALTVLISHFMLLINGMEKNTFGDSNYWVQNVLKYSPIHLFWAGSEAVIFFFILSGFVLALPLINGKSIPYGTYVLKRICRIYIPYFCALIVSIIAYYFCHNIEINGPGNWIEGFWNEKFSLKLFLEHLILIGDFNDSALDPVIWSLVHEMRISLIFPFIVMFIVKFDWKKSLLLGFVSYAVGYYFYHHYYNEAHNLSNYYDTFRYLFMFIIGAILAKHRVEIAELFLNLAKWMKIITGIFALFLYTHKWNLYGMTLIHKQFFNDFAVILGVALIIIFSISSKTVSSFLKIRIIHFLGKCSYSLYMYHAIVLLTVSHLLKGYSLLTIGSVGLIFSFIISIIAYYFVEIPSINLSKRLSNNKKVITKTNVA